MDWIGGQQERIKEREKGKNATSSVTWVRSRQGDYVAAKEGKGKEKKLAVASSTAQSGRLLLRFGGKKREKKNAMLRLSLRWHLPIREIAGALKGGEKKKRSYYRVRRFPAFAG